MGTTHTVKYGTTTISFELEYAERKTLGVSVHPDLRITVTAPEGATVEEVKARVTKRGGWILEQQRDFERYLPQLPPRKYVNGETHRYLGRQYRLKVMVDERDLVRRTRHFIHVHSKTGNPGDVRDLLHAWYRARAEHVFAERLARCYPLVEHLGLPFPELAIRVLKSRWGHCKGNVITLNVKLVQVPKEYIDYVLYHELCHLAEPNHNTRFYELLTRVLPDWEARKEALDGFEFG